MINKNHQEYKDLFLKELSKLQDIEGPSYLYDPIKYILQSNGKRLRPLIVQFLGDLFNNDPNFIHNLLNGVNILELKIPKSKKKALIIAKVLFT